MREPQRVVLVNRSAGCADGCSGCVSCAVLIVLLALTLLFWWTTR